MRRELKRFVDATAALRAAESEHTAAFRAAFPVGMDVEWAHNGYGQWGTVKMHAYRDRLIATNARTDKDVSVDGFNLLKTYVPDGEGKHEG